MLRREVVHPTNPRGKLVSEERKRQKQLVKKAEDMLTRLHYEVERWGEIKLVDPMDIIDMLHSLKAEIAKVA